MNRFDEAVSASEAAHREKMKQGSDNLLEAIRAAREGRTPNTAQLTLRWL